MLFSFVAKREAIKLPQYVYNVLGKYIVKTGMHGIHYFIPFKEIHFKIFPLRLLSVAYYPSLSEADVRRLIVITNIFPNVWEVDLVIYTGVSLGR